MFDNKLVDLYDEEKICEYRGETYSVRDNGAVMRHVKEGKKARPLDNKWTFGTVNVQKGYTMISSEPIHRIVATAFLGEAPSKNHVVDHIDTNRQNNRPSNLRWVTRLENIVLNEITRKKLELLCGCSIDDILSDISILQTKQLTPQFSWMKAVSKEEAEQSLVTWKNWVNNVTLRTEHDRNITQSFKINGNHKKSANIMIYPLEPLDKELSLDLYFEQLKIKKTFCYKDYSTGRVKFKIIDYYLNKETKVLSVATTSGGGIKSLFLTSVTLNNNSFHYETRSFFSPDGIEKYMTLARGEEWTGGDVIDDFC